MNECQQKNEPESRILVHWRKSYAEFEFWQNDFFLSDLSLLAKLKLLRALLEVGNFLWLRPLSRWHRVNSLLDCSPTVRTQLYPQTTDQALK